MDKKCMNCRHFRQGSVEPTKPEYVWGDCLKAKKRARSREGTGTAASFTWADGSCEHFEPIEMSQNNQNADSL